MGIVPDTNSVQALRVNGVRERLAAELTQTNVFAACGLQLRLT